MSRAASPKRFAAIRPWLFPLGVAGVYGAALWASPEKAARSWGFFLTIGGQLILPLCLAMGIMVVSNRFLSPDLVVRFLNRHAAGFKGVVLSSVAGIISMGPILAWFPLFRNLQRKGMSTFFLANFLGCRSIKPPLLPVLIGYFGWRFALVFVLASLGVALCSAWTVARVCPPDKA